MVVVCCVTSFFMKCFGYANKTLTLLPCCRLSLPLSSCREALRRGTANLPWVDVLPSVGLNVYSILQRDHLVITRGALEALVGRLRRPIKPCSLTP